VADHLGLSFEKLRGVYAHAIKDMTGKHAGSLDKAISAARVRQ
jgi:hypothetical protein